MTKEAAETTGEAKETAVATGQLDCNAGWVGAGAITEGDIQMNLGTCSNFCIIHCKPEFHNNMIAFAYTTDSENIYITVPTTTTGGQLIRYMRDNFYRLVMEQENQCGTDTCDLTNQEAECVRPGSDGLVVLGHLMGERTPIWDVYVRVVVFGLSMNHVRSYDITQERLENGRKVHILNVIDEFGRECPASEAALSIKQHDVIELLHYLFPVCGYAAYLHSDNGSQFTAARVKRFLKDLGVDTLFTEPGSPWENG